MVDDFPAWRRDGVKIRYDLTPSEIVWRNRQKMLERHGYLLRPRFRPDWVPSWLNDPKKKPILCEDSIHNILIHLIDAKRLSDGMPVMLKAIERGSTETRIASYLSSEENAKDPMNNCVPILDIFTDDALPTLEFLAMPVLRPFDDPPFFSVAEVLDFIQQTLQGLTFMHKRSVAHRDCSDNNVMFDAAGMYPKGFHPSLLIWDADAKIAHPVRRSDVPSVKYYFTDFGMSRRFLDGELRFVTGNDGLDREVPEFSLPFEPYDPFPVDVFTLGNVYKRNFTQKYTNMDFLAPLVDAMTQHEPCERPSAAEALAHFDALVSRIPAYARRWQLRRKGTGRLTLLMQDVRSAWRECVHRLLQVSCLAHDCVSGPEISVPDKEGEFYACMNTT